MKNHDQCLRKLQSPNDIQPSLSSGVSDAPASRDVKWLILEPDSAVGIANPIPADCWFIVIACNDKVTEEVLSYS